MPRVKKKAGERMRDEKRTDGGPRMDGRQWHDHEEPRDLEPEAMAAPDAVPEVESSGDREGMGKARKAKGRARQMQRSPRGKGVARPNATGTGHGKRGRR